MRIRILSTLLTLALAVTTAQAQPCVGFTADFNDLIDAASVDLLPSHGYFDPQPVLRGGVEYSGATLSIGTECPGAYGSLAMCDFSGTVTGVPATGTTLRRFGVDYWADVWINPFQLEIELDSGTVENYTATVSGGFVGYCAPSGQTIVRVEMTGHDGVATAIYYGEDGPVATENVGWSAAKALYRD